MHWHPFPTLACCFFGSCHNIESTAYSFLVFALMDDLSFTALSKAPSKLTLAMKKSMDANHTIRWTAIPCISKQYADPSQAPIERSKRPTALATRGAFHSMESLHKGNKQRYHVKYCAVITLLCVTNKKVWMKRARLRLLGATPKLV